VDEMRVWQRHRTAMSGDRQVSLRFWFLVGAVLLRRRVVSPASSPILKFFRRRGTRRDFPDQDPASQCLMNIRMNHAGAVLKLLLPAPGGSFTCPMG